MVGSSGDDTDVAGSGEDDQRLATGGPAASANTRGCDLARRRRRRAIHNIDQLDIRTFIPGHHRNRRTRITAASDHAAHG